MPGSIPALRRANLTTVQDMVVSLSLSTEAPIFDQPSPLPKVGLVRQSINKRDQEPFHCSPWQVEDV